MVRSRVGVNVRGMGTVGYECVLQTDAAGRLCVPRRKRVGVTKLQLGASRSHAGILYFMRRSTGMPHAAFAKTFCCCLVLPHPAASAHHPEQGAPAAQRHVARPGWTVR